MQPVRGDSLRCRETPQAKILRRPGIHTQVFHRFSTYTQYPDYMRLTDICAPDFNRIAVSLALSRHRAKKNLNARPYPAARIRTRRTDPCRAASDRIPPKSSWLPADLRWECTYGN